MSQTSKLIQLIQRQPQKATRLVVRIRTEQKTLTVRYDTIRYDTIRFIQEYRTQHLQHQRQEQQRQQPHHSLPHYTQPDFLLYKSTFRMTTTTSITTTFTTRMTTRPSQSQSPRQQRRTKLEFWLFLTTIVLSGYAIPTTNANNAAAVSLLDGRYETTTDVTDYLNLAHDIAKMNEALGFDTKFDLYKFVSNKYTSANKCILLVNK